jgi:hypothetical protein
MPFDPSAIKKRFQRHAFPPLPALTEDGLKVTLKERTGILEVPFAVGFGGGEARKRFVKQGGDSPLFGE